MSDTASGRVERLPADEEVGPYFPSGMSAPEAMGAGAKTLEEKAEAAAEAAEEVDDSV